MTSKATFGAPTDANQATSGRLLKQMFGAGLVWLEHNHEYVNQLNVFPVPDGDTGTNMLLTVREAYQNIDTDEDLGAGEVARRFARGAVNGSRGNSGTILSQLLVGIAKVLDNQDDFDADTLAAAVESAVELAYKAVKDPREGTILTVARETKDRVVKRVAGGERDMTALLKAMVFASRASLRRTPDLLPILKQAGVVDSGGQGLVYILEGMLQFAAGKPMPKPRVVTEEEAPNWEEALQPDDEEGYGYDVQFRMTGYGLDVDEIRQAIDDLGWSTVVVGDETLIKVHVHVHDPGKPISYAISLGVDIDDVVVENMQMQYQTFVQDRAEREADAPVEGVAAIVVAPGVGFRRLFGQELGAAHVVMGGQTMNPSTGEFLKAIERLPNDDIVILPNNKNILLAAQQAAENVEGKRVRVVPSRTIPQGINAMLAYESLRGSDDIDAVAGAMTEALSEAVSAEITTATRDVEIGGVTVSTGQLIGLLEGNLVVAGSDMLPVMRDLLKRANAYDFELITLYFGLDMHKDKVQTLVDDLSEDFPDQEFELVYGGQALYPFIISIE
jgi:hypothetical protein